MPVLSGAQIEELARLLVKRFDKPGIRPVVLVSLGTRLDAIVNEDQPFERIAFDLVNWADRQGRSALVKLLRGMVTVRPDDAGIWTFCDEVFKDEIQRLDSRVLVDRVNRGIEALVALKDLPIVQQTVGQFRADFEASSKQIQILKKYKSLHDGLHRLQLKIRTIEEVIEAAKTDQRAARSLTLHAIELAPLAKKARQQAQGLPGAQNEIGWIDEFDDHIATMNRASKQTMSTGDLEDLASGLNQLLPEGPRINSLLANVVRPALRQSRPGNVQYGQVHPGQCRSRGCDVSASYGRPDRFQHAAAATRRPRRPAFRMAVGRQRASRRCKSFL